MAARKRKDGESFKDYRRNLKNEEYATQRKLSGSLLWNTPKLGTYVRAKHGVL